MGRTDFDAIVIGAGHNGLVCAFYLARAGPRVLMVEARDIVGGSCVTEELVPGFRFSTCANVVWSLRPKIVRDMALHERGLKVVARQFLRIFPDRTFFYSGQYTTYLRPDETDGGGTDSGDPFREALARVSPHDAATYPRWQALLGRLTALLGPYLLQSPPTIGELYAGCRDPSDREALDMVLTTPATELARRFFESG